MRYDINKFRPIHIMKKIRSYASDLSFLSFDTDLREIDILQQDDRCVMGVDLDPSDLFERNDLR